MLWGSHGFLTHWAKVAFWRLRNFSHFCLVWSVRVTVKTAPERIAGQPRKSIISRFPSKSFARWSCVQNGGVQASDGREHKGPSVLAGWFAPHARLRSLCGQAALMLAFSYLSPGKVNEVAALFEEVKMGWVAKTRGSLEMKRGALSGCKWQFWWIT